MSLFDIEDVKVAENDVCTFYTNDCTAGAEDWAKKIWGIDDIKCLLVVQKANSCKEYVLVRNNEYIYNSQSYEALAVYIDVIAFSEGRERL